MANEIATQGAAAKPTDVDAQKINQAGAENAPRGIPHSDGSRFSDGSGYARVKTETGVNSNGK